MIQGVFGRFEVPPYARRLSERLSFVIFLSRTLSQLTRRDAPQYGNSCSSSGRSHDGVDPERSRDESEAVPDPAAPVGPLPPPRRAPRPHRGPRSPHGGSHLHRTAPSLLAALAPDVA